VPPSHAPCRNTSTFKPVADFAEPSRRFTRPHRSTFGNCPARPCAVNAAAKQAIVKPREAPEWRRCAHIAVSAVTVEQAEDAIVRADVRLRERTPKQRDSGRAEGSGIGS
jgi:hypothetical protein